MTEPERAAPVLTLPAALLWIREEGDGRVLAAARQHGRPRAGVAWLRPDLAAVFPTAGDPAVFDAAISLASSLFGAAGTAKLTALVLPGRVRVAGEEVTPLDEPLLDDLAQKPPACRPGQLCVTSYAAARLEVRRRLTKAGTYDGPSGSRVPVLRVEDEEPESPPWRSPELLRRRLAYVLRPAPDAALAVAPAVARVTGVLGSGKTRSVHHATHQDDRAPLWLVCRPERHGGPGLAAQLLARLWRAAAAEGWTLPRVSELEGRGEISLQALLAPQDPPPALRDPRMAAELLLDGLERARAGAGGPRTVVCDGLEAATRADVDLACLLARAAGARRFRLLLVARSGTRWPEALAAAPEIEVPPMEEQEWSLFTRNAFAGFSLPAPVEERISAAVAGLPFALEEGLTALVHRRRMRQVYGSFFFAGDDDTPYLPSDRLVQHAEAEIRRLGEPEALRRLALADTPMPPEVLSAGPAGPGWHDAYVAAGLVAPEESPWGPGWAIPFPALRLALASSLAPEEARRVREEIGRALPAGDPASAWWRHRLLAGAPEAAGALLEAVQAEAAPPEELLAALVAEVERRGGRDEDPGTELDLLWQLLPLARRLGRLTDFAAELGRARRLAADDPKRYLALSGLKAELDEVEGRFGDAESTIREALKHWGIGRESGAAMLVIRLGRLLIRQDRQQEARELLEQVEPLLKGGKAPSLHASCLFYLGNVALHQERLEDALALHRRGLALRRQLGQAKTVGTSLSAIGRVSQRLGHYIEALDAYREAQSVFEASGEEEEASFALLGIGRVLARLGDFAAAAAPLRKALALREQGDDVVGQTIARLAVAENFLHLKQPAAALEEARRAHFDLSMLPESPADLGDAEQLLGRILLLQRQGASAAVHFATAAELHRKHQAREPLAFDLARGIEAALAAGDGDEVRRLSGELEVLLAGSQHLERREVLEIHLYRGLARLEQAGDPQGRSLPHLRRAYRALLRKAEPLPGDMRHRFLFQIPEHESVVAAATKEGLSFPDLPLSREFL